MTAAALMVKCLEDEGVRYIFGVPGEENLDLLEALSHSSIIFIPTRHEQGAAFMAATYGRLTGQAGVCLSTLGPGATNLVTGIAQASLGGMPLVAITGQKALLRNWQSKFQILDIINLFKPIVKWNKIIVAPATVPQLVRHAFKIAEEERPGPTHLELPEDIAGEQAPQGLTSLARVKVRRGAPDAKAIQLAVDLLKSAKTPVIIVSAGANRKRVQKQLLNLVNATGLHVIHTQMGKGVLPDDHPQSLFAMGIHRRDLVHCAIEQADVVITIGYHLAEYPPSVWNPHKDKKILHLDFVPAEPDDHYNPTLEVIADVSHTLWALSEALQGTKWSTPSFDRLRSSLMAKMVEHKDDQHFPLKPQKIVCDVREVMGREDIVTLDNGIYKIWFARFYPTYAENTLILDNALATMGAGLPAAMTAKLLFPEKKVLCVVGDGGFLMSSMEMETTMRLKLPIVILLVRDDAYGFIKWKQQAEGFKDFGLDFSNPDFVKYAESFGAIGWRVEKTEDFAPILKRAFEQNRLVLIDCPIDYADNMKELTQGLSNLVCPT